MIHTLRALRALILAGGLLSFASGLAVAADSESLDALSAAIGSASISDVERQVGSALLDMARADQIETERVQSLVRQRQAESAAHVVRVRELETSLAVDLDNSVLSWAKRLPSQADVETLERVLAQERNQVAELSVQIDDVADELAFLLSGPAEAADALARLRDQLAALQNQPITQDDEPRIVAEARRQQQEHERTRLLAEIELAEMDQATLEQRQALHEIRLRELRHRVRLHSARVQVLQEHITERGNNELEARRARLAAVAEGLTDAPAELGALALANIELGAELEANVRALAADRVSLPALTRARDDVVAALRDSRTRLDLGSHSEGVGRWLWSERRRLESSVRLRQELENVGTSLADQRLRLVVLSEEQRDVADHPIKLSDEIESGQSDERGERGERNEWDAKRIKREAGSLRATREDLLSMLRAVLQRRVAALEEKDATLSEQLAQTLEMQALLDRQLLWSRSHGPVSAAWLATIGTGLGDLFKLERYEKSAELAKSSLQQRPLIWMFSALGVLILLRLSGQASERITAEALVTRQIREDTYRATARALGWTILAALPFSAVLLVGGTLLGLIGEAGNFSHSFGLAMITTAGPLFFVQLLRYTAIERGLGQAHFRWRRARRESLTASLPIMALLVLPLYFLSALGAARSVDVATDVIARLAIIMACGLLGWTMWTLLAPGKIWTAREAESETSNWRKVVRVGGTAAPLLIAGLALTGYVYSASVLLQTMLASFSAAVLIALVVGLLSRWFLLGERRLAYQQLLAQQGTAEAAVARSELERDVTLEQINAQTGRLLRAIRWTLIVTALVWVWADVLPAFARLDEFAMWQFTELGDDGKMSVQQVTLMALVLGSLVLVLTLISARNVPGLVEIGLLSRTRIDAPTRYAITNLLRYAIVIAGSLIGLGMLGMRWSQLQWLAAALSVGLGFGLQEIFANFVSGLILLFERPFRVGDIITVGEYTGEVTRIRTRATTIQDFDRREVVVPNKQFITGQLTNWTLTDSITRLTVKVSVDGGTDVALVLRLLKQAADEQPLVLREPTTQCWLLAHNNGSLDFDIRVFVASIADRLPVQGALNRRIGELFSEQGVRIASPQLGVTIHPDSNQGPSPADQSRGQSSLRLDSRKDRSAKDLSTKDLSAEDLSAKDLSAEDLSHKDIEAP